MASANSSAPSFIPELNSTAWWLLLFGGERQGVLQRSFGGPAGMPPVILMGHGKAVVRGHVSEPHGEALKGKQWRGCLARDVTKGRPRSEVKAGLWEEDSKR